MQDNVLSDTSGYCFNFMSKSLLLVSTLSFFTLSSYWQLFHFSMFALFHQCNNNKDTQINILLNGSVAVPMVTTPCWHKLQMNLVNKEIIVGNIEAKSVKTSRIFEFSRQNHTQHITKRCKWIIFFSSYDIRSFTLPKGKMAFYNFIELFQ